MPEVFLMATVIEMVTYQILETISQVEVILMAIQTWKVTYQILEIYSMERGISTVTCFETF